MKIKEPHIRTTNKNNPRFPFREAEVNNSMNFFTYKNT